MTRVLGDNTAKGMNAFASTQSPSRTDSSDPKFKIKEEADIEDLEVDNFKVGVKESDCMLCYVLFRNFIVLPFLC